MLLILYSRYEDNCGEPKIFLHWDLLHGWINSHFKAYSYKKKMKKKMKSIKEMCARKDILDLIICITSRLSA